MELESSPMIFALYFLFFFFFLFSFVRGFLAFIDLKRTFENFGICR